MTVAAARRTRRDPEAGTPLRHRLTWTVPQFANVSGFSHPFLYRRLTKAPGGQRAVIHLPGGVDVRARRDESGWWRIYRAEYEAAEEAARASEPAGGAR